MKLHQVTDNSKNKLVRILESLKRNYSIDLDLSNEKSLKKLENTAKEIIDIGKKNKSMNVFESKDEKGVHSAMLILHAIKLNKKINEGTELERAEYLLASKDIVDDLQNMIESVSKMQVEKIPAIVDRIKMEKGFAEAENYKNATLPMFSQVISVLTKTKEDLDNITLSLSGVIDIDSLPSNTEMNQSEEADMENVDKEKKSGNSISFDEDELRTKAKNALGRERKDESLDSPHESDKLKVGDKVIYSDPVYPTKPKKGTIVKIDNTPSRRYGHRMIYFRDSEGNTEIVLGSQLKLINESWNTETKVSEKNKGKWEGWTKEELQRELKSLKNKKNHSEEDTKTIRQIDFALRAKNKWGKVNESAYDVYLNGKLIDTVFYNAGIDIDQIKKDLINHDGYDNNIKVVQEPNISDEVNESAYDVYLNGKLIDTVFYNAGIDIDQIKKDLINHDGYDNNIKVVQEPNISDEVNESAYDVKKRAFNNTKHYDSFFNHKTGKWNVHLVGDTTEEMNIVRGSFNTEEEADKKARMLNREYQKQQGFPSSLYVKDKFDESTDFDDLVDKKPDSPKIYKVDHRYAADAIKELATEYSKERHINFEDALEHTLDQYRDWLKSYGGAEKIKGIIDGKYFEEAANSAQTQVAQSQSNQINQTPQYTSLKKPLPFSKGSTATQGNKAVIIDDINAVNPNVTTVKVKDSEFGPTRVVPKNQLKVTESDYSNKTVHQGDLRILESDDTDYSHITEVTGNLEIFKEINLPALIKVTGDLDIHDDVILPALYSIGRNFYLSSGNRASLPSLTKIAENLSISNRSSLRANKLVSVGGKIWVRKDSGIDLPSLTMIGGNLHVEKDAFFEADKLARVGGDIKLYSDTNLPSLVNVGGDHDNFNNTAKLIAPKLVNKNINESDDFEVNLYIVKVKHDRGTINIKTTASSENAAKEKVMKAEGCPESAILSINKIKKLTEHDCKNCMNCKNKNCKECSNCKVLTENPMKSCKLHMTTKEGKKGFKTFNDENIAKDWIKKHGHKVKIHKVEMIDEDGCATTAGNIASVPQVLGQVKKRTNESYDNETNMIYSLKKTNPKEFIAKCKELGISTNSGPNEISVALLKKK